MNEGTAKILGWIVVLALPWALAFNVITGVVGRWVPGFEYGQKNFPVDTYGFTQAQRLDLALVAVDYLEAWGSADEMIFMLEEQTLPGTSDPLYNEREIDHMVDVKRLTDTIRVLGWGLGVVVVGGLVLLLFRPNSADIAYRSLRNGGILTLIILAGIGSFMGLFWQQFFVAFHELLFPEGSWTFYLSDSLIRLFPEKLWMDVGLYIVGGTLLLTLLAIFAGHRLLTAGDGSQQSTRNNKTRNNKKKRKSKRVLKPKPNRK